DEAVARADLAAAVAATAAFDLALATLGETKADALADAVLRRSTADADAAQAFTDATAAAADRQTHADQSAREGDVINSAFQFDDLIDQVLPAFAGYLDGADAQLTDSIEGLDLTPGGGVDSGGNGQDNLNAIIGSTAAADG